MTKKVLKMVSVLFISILLALGGFLAYMTITDYQPDAVITLDIENQSSTTFPSNETFKVATFNIGYGGLDASEDFFMDGGTHSRASSLTQVKSNLNTIGNVAKDLDADFYFFQEVDQKATRSFKVNELEYLAEIFPNYAYTFAQNYLVSFVPVPITKPHGQVDAGLASFSKYNIKQATRFDLPGKEKWPIQLFELDRAMLEQRIPLDNEKELVLVNVHLSAYDKGGIIRKQQLQFLKEYLSNEYSKGNYIIMGGDFNHLLPTTDPTIFPTTETWPDWLQTIPDDFLTDNFYWVVDKNVPTARTIATSYKKGENFLAVIDGFIVSKNIETISVEGTNMEFEASDHHPVTAIFKLKE